MENNPFFNNPDPNAIPTENSLVSTAEAEQESLRKSLSYKRTTILLIVLCAIVAAFILWEIVDIAMGGRP